MYNSLPMKHLRIILLIPALLLPIHVHAFLVPERDHWRNFVLHQINLSRVEHHLAPVGIDDELTDLSQTHAEDSATSFDDSTMEIRRETYLAHVSSDGGELDDRIREMGITGASRFGENVGFRHRGPIEDPHDLLEEGILLIHKGMMDEVPPDDGHRKTILGDFTHVGVGLEFHKHKDSDLNTLFIVTDFAKFIDGRKVIIPELGENPKTIIPIIAPDKRIERQRSKRIDRLQNRIANMTRQRRETQPASKKTVSPEKTAKTLSWAERNRARVESRRSERLERLLGRVEERRRKRLERRGI